MKKLTMMMAMLMVASMGFTAPAPVEVSDLSLEGEIEGENIVFTLTFKADVNQKNAVLPLVIGDVAYLDGQLPRKSELVRQGSKYALKFGSSSKQEVTFRFASRALKDGDWRKTSFSIPAANIRKLSVICDRDDLKIQFPGALDIKRQKVKRVKQKDEKMQVTAFLGISGMFQVRWKPEVKRLASDLVVSCDANTIATASVGALRLDSVFTYRVIQGSLSKLSFALPNVNVTQVSGLDIQDWSIDRTDKKNPKLLVSLGRPQEGVYRLKVESEMILPKFPSSFDLPVIAPENVIRTSGFLMVGTDSAIKMQVTKAAGLTQIDQGSFPTVVLAKEKRSRPTKSNYAYQYASTPYTLAINADDIVTSYSADGRLVLALSDNELVFDAQVEIDIKDAPAREIMIETDLDAEWTVTSITGRHVSEADSDVREKNGKRIIYVPFKTAVRGVALINIRMEKTLKANVKKFSSPGFRVVGARSERGYLVMASEKGVRLNAVGETKGLQEVYTGSAPMTVANAQQAFRYKKSGWSVELNIDRTVSAIYSEVIHIVSLGEGVQYNSAAITYHIDGAPIQEFKIKVPKEIETVEFTGADVEGWTRSEEVVTIRLHTKVIGDYSLLVTYDKQFDYTEKGSDITAGGVETIGAESEIGYIAFVSSLSLNLSEAKGMTKIDADEIPAEYAAPLADPILGAYKFVKNPHVAKIHVTPYKADQLLGQVADYVKLKTVISRDGESKTTATYYIKNTAGQYLVVSLPPGVETTYSIALVSENGQRRRVSSQKNEKGQLMIPVRRPRDPNTPIRVEVVYAQSHGELGFWNSGVKGLDLVSPMLPNTHATVTSWGIEVKSEPADRYVIESASDTKATLGLVGVFGRAYRLGKAIVDGPGKLTVKSVFTDGWSGLSVMDSTKTVNLSGSGALTLKVRLVPEWLGSTGSVSKTTTYGIAGLMILAVGFVMKRNTLICALGLTVFTFGFTHSAVGCSIMSAVLVLVALIALKMLGAFKLLFKILKLILISLPKALFGKAQTAREARHEVRKQAVEEIRHSVMDIPAEPAVADGPSPFDYEEEENRDVMEQDDSNNTGSITMKMLLMIMAIAVAGSAVLAKPQARRVVHQPVYTPVMDSMVVSIDGPGTGRDNEQSAKVTLNLEFRAERDCSFVVVPSTCVLKEYELSSKYMEIKARHDGYMLIVKRKGKYKATIKYQAPVTQDKQNGKWMLGIGMLSNMKNKVTLRLPEKELDIKSEEGVLFKVKDSKEATEAEAVFGPVAVAHFTWQPRVRKTDLEDAVFFCEVNTFTALRSGVVDLANVIRYQIAQGEVKDVKVKIPEGMSVTAVKAPGLATWSFDPKTRFLDAILEKPVSGTLVMTVITQISREGLPYSAVIGVLEVIDASRQRGSIALAAPDTVQVKVDDKKVKGLHPMNIEDFTAMTATGNARRPKKSSMTIRKAFRYHETEEVSVSVSTEKVLSEIRVTETAILDITDERMKLATTLNLAIAKSGVFSIEFGIPEGFDVETLSGNDVSHWDEKTEGGRGVTVHFSRQVTDATTIQLVVARMEKGVDEQINVPRVTIRDARKHKGRLTISGERGVRIMVDSHRGVDILKASQEGIRQKGVLMFDILRPTWAIGLKTEVMKPLVKPEVLQWVDLTEGMLQCTAYIQYKVENAGLKTFRLKAPRPGVKLSVTGANVARVAEVDKEKSIWQIDMHNKVEKQYLTVKYQIPYAPEEKKAGITPLRTVDTEPQRGYLVVTCRGRVQVKPSETTGLKVENPRNIPVSFKAGDLSSAILCYRTVGPDYKLGMSVVRHDSANVLPAHIKQVRMMSVTSTRRTLLTRVVLKMTVGNLRLLRVQLPNADDDLWTVQVGGKEVSTSRDGELYLVPLEAINENRVTTVDMIYAGMATSRLGSGLNFNAPRFAYKDSEQKKKMLPLDDIEWTFFVDPSFKYHAFDGTMRHMETEEERIELFDAEKYLARNRRQQVQSLQMAKQAMDYGERLVKAGNPRMAQKVFEQALTLSQGEATLNEDARVQLRNVKVQQAKMGLVNRRNVVRYNANVFDEKQFQQMKGFKGGNFTQEYAGDVEKELSDKDNDALDALANKMLDQQTAAAGVVTAIRVIMPEHGKVLKFSRTMSTQSDTELNVSFKVSTGRMGQLSGEIAIAAVIFLAFWGAISFRRSNRQA